MASIFFSLIFILAVVDAAKQTKGLSEVRVIGMGIVASLGGMAVLFVTTMIVAYVATVAMFAVVADGTALKVVDNDWYSRGLSIGTTVALYYPFSRIVQAWYRKAEGEVSLPIEALSDPSDDATLQASEQEIHPVDHSGEGNKNDG